jgi:hypothetical protein
VKEITQALLVVMRRGSLAAAEEITGHKWETVREWLVRANAQAEAVTRVLVKDLELDEVEIDAFWSFVGNAVEALQRRHPRNKGWATQLGMEQVVQRRRVKSGASAGGV